MLRWSVAGVTDCGSVRKTNEDSFFISPDKRVFAVGDGMGGSGRGEQASAMTMAAIEGLWREGQPNSDMDEVKNWMVEAISRANKCVLQANLDHSHPSGSTVVLAIPFSDGRIAISHVGDSRAYRIRAERAELLTSDHTLLNEMIKAGKITAEQVRHTSCGKKLLLRAIGHVETVDIEQQDFQLKPKDTILLCTDGLSYELDDEEIAVNGRMEDPVVACENLLRSAIDNGAPDNVTVIAIHCFEAE